MANTLSLGSGNWGAKESLLLGYYENGGKFFPETFDVTRATGGTRVNKNGLIETPAEIGSELIVNGDFSNGSANWSLTRGNVINNELVFNTTGAPSGSRSVFAIQNNVADLTKVYKVQFTISNYVSGQFRLRKPFITTDTFGNGTYTYYGTASEINFELQGRLDIVHNFSIDNISVKEYNDKNLARIDYLDDAKGALLTEPQSTNLITQSELFSDSSWTKNNTTVTSGFVSPDGTTNSFKLVESNLFERHFIFISLSGFTPSVKYTQSWYVKAGERHNVRIQDAADGSYFGSYNLITGALIDEGTNSVGKTTITALSNGWYRLTLTSDQATNARYPFMGILPDDYIAGDGLYYQGDGTSGVYIFGAQLEGANAVGYNGEYSTSYIPTNGSTVTRNKDEVTNGGDVNSFNSEEGVLYVEIAALANDGTNRYITLSDGTANNSVRIYLNSNGTQLSGQLRLNGALQCLFNHTVSDLLALNKIAFKYKQNDFSFWINGVEVDTDTSGNTPVGLSKLSFNRGDGTQIFFGNTKNIQVFNTALSDSDLLSLTTTGSVPYWKQYSAMATTLNYTNK
jgi:hypothetical protein